MPVEILKPVVIPKEISLTMFEWVLLDATNYFIEFFNNYHLQKCEWIVRRLQANRFNVVDAEKRKVLQLLKAEFEERSQRVDCINKESEWKKLKDIINDNMADENERKEAISRLDELAEQFSRYASVAHLSAEELAVVGLVMQLFSASLQATIDAEKEEICQEVEDILKEVIDKMACCRRQIEACMQAHKHADSIKQDKREELTVNQMGRHQIRIERTASPKGGRGSPSDLMLASILGSRSLPPCLNDVLFYVDNCICAVLSSQDKSLRNDLWVDGTLQAGVSGLFGQLGVAGVATVNDYFGRYLAKQDTLSIISFEEVQLRLKKWMEKDFFLECEDVWFLRVDAICRRVTVLKWEASPNPSAYFQPAPFETVPRASSGQTVGPRSPWPM